MFQSTRPARGATPHQTQFLHVDCFNPRAPRGARHRKLPSVDAILMFQSTRPARGATWRRRGG